MEERLTFVERDLDGWCGGGRLFCSRQAQGVYFVDEDEDEGRERHPQCIIRQKNQSHTTDSSSRRMCMWRTLRHVGE